MNTLLYDRELYTIGDVLEAVRMYRAMGLSCLIQRNTGISRYMAVTIR